MAGCLLKDLRLCFRVLQDEVALTNLTPAILFRKRERAVDDCNLGYHTFMLDLPSRTGPKRLGKALARF